MKKYVPFLVLVPIIFGIKFALESAFPKLQASFGHSGTEASVIALFSVVIIYKLYTGMTQRKQDDNQPE